MLKRGPKFAVSADAKPCFLTFYCRADRRNCFAQCALIRKYTVIKFCSLRCDCTFTNALVLKMGGIGNDILFCIGESAVHFNFSCDVIAQKPHCVFIVVVTVTL